MGESNVRHRRPERERERFRVDAFDSFTGWTLEIGWITLERGSWWLLVESEDPADDAEGFCLRVRVPPSLVKALIRERGTLRREMAKREREERTREAEARRADQQLAEKNGGTT